MNPFNRLNTAREIIKAIQRNHLKPFFSIGMHINIIQYIIRANLMQNLSLTFLNCQFLSFFRSRLLSFLSNNCRKTQIPFLHLLVNAITIKSFGPIYLFKIEFSIYYPKILKLANKCIYLQYLHQTIKERAQYSQLNRD